MYDDEYVLELRQACNRFARDMVRLERWAQAAYKRQNFARVGDLMHVREEVQMTRSAVMREMLAVSGRRRIREALREA
jgi:hypothetical protein